MREAGRHRQKIIDMIGFDIGVPGEAGSGRQVLTGTDQSGTGCPDGGKRGGGEVKFFTTSVIYQGHTIGWRVPEEDKADRMTE